MSTKKSRKSAVGSSQNIMAKLIMGAKNGSAQSSDDMVLANLAAKYLELVTSPSEEVTQEGLVQHLNGLLHLLADRLPVSRTDSNELDQLVEKYENQFMSPPKEWQESDLHLNLIFLARLIGRDFEAFVLKEIRTLPIM